jgi:hypothetical protein
LYYEDFVRPSTIPGLTTEDQSYSAKVLSHLQRHSHIWREHSTDWKRQYKIQYNWFRGKCHIRELTVNDDSSPFPLITRLCKRHIYSLEVKTQTIKVWSTTDQRSLGIFKFTDPEALPSAFAINPSRTNVNEHELLVGFANGSFIKLVFDTMRGSFTETYTHEAKASSATITDIAYYAPYVATFSNTRVFSVYRFQGSPINAAKVFSLQSNRQYAQCTVSFRLLNSTLHAAVIFVLFGTCEPIIQESLINYDTAEVLSSRLATAQHPQRSAGRYPGPTPWRFNYSKANSISYSYPYIVVPLSDNSVLAYVVKSTATELSLTHLERLIGHTEGVAGAQVESSGKAVSVGRTARDVWIWQLNEMQKDREDLSERDELLESDAEVSDSIDNSGFLDGQTTKWARKQREWERLEGDRWSIRIQPQTLRRSGAKFAGYMGFDDESVVVLKIGHKGEQNVAVYDFS